VWRLPLHAEYAEMIKGRYADIVNTTEARKGRDRVLRESLVDHLERELPARGPQVAAERLQRRGDVESRVRHALRTSDEPESSRLRLSFRGFPSLRPGGKPTVDGGRD